MNERTPKVALVTGAEGFLGTAVRERFLSAGCEVLGLHHPDAKKEQLPARDRLSWVPCDLGDSQSVHKAISPYLNRIDALIHCAGGFRYGMIGELTDDDLKFLLDGNLRAAIFLLRELIPSMKTRGFGRVAIVSARASLQAPKGMAAYAAAKAGLNALVASVADEVRKHDINVNAVLPSMLDTPANRQSMPEADPSDWVRTEALAEIIFGLTQPSANPINGALIPVSGRV